MKPHIRKMHSVESWWCGDNGHGFGVLGPTPAKALEAWQRHNPPPALPRIRRANSAMGHQWEVVRNGASTWRYIAAMAHANTLNKRGGKQA